MKEQKLTIKYKITEKLDEKMDKELEKLLKKYGWKFEGSGFNFTSNERDLVFQKPTNNK